VKCRIAIAALDNSVKQLGSRVDNVETKICGEIEKLGKNMDIRYSKIETKINDEFRNTCEKMEIRSRDLGTKIENMGTKIACEIKEVGDN